MYIKVLCAVKSSVCIKPPVCERVCVYKILCAKAVLSRSLPPKISPSYFHAFLPAKLSPNYFHGFPSVQHAVSLPPGEAFRKLFALFPLRPACWLASSQQSSPQAISNVSCPSSMSRSLPAKLSTRYLHVISSPSSMLSRSFPAKLNASYCHCFVSRPACCLAPSQRSFPTLFSTVLSRPASGLAPS